MRRAILLLTLAALLLGTLAFAPADRSETASRRPVLRAGAAVADITPEVGGTTLGYVRPDVSTDGVATRLTARAIVLDDGGTKVAILATDLGYALRKDDLVARVADLGFGHDTILYTGSHTHGGPESLADWQVEQLAEAIRQADAALRPAEAAWITADVGNVNRNRSIEAHLANHGHDLFYGQGSPIDDPDGPDHARDTRLRLLRVDGVDGTPLAAWMIFPVHLTTYTPDNTYWSADLAGPLTGRVAETIGIDGFVGLFSNSSSGDLAPRFEAHNQHATADLLARRLADVAIDAWDHAGTELRRDVDIDARWTRPCYCGQEVEPGKPVAPQALWGLPFLGGSEEGASIFHEPVATEGRRRPAEAADPVQGRKIVAAPAPWTSEPEVAAIRIGDRLLLAAPGEPSVQMGRRFEAAVEPVLPTGVDETVTVGLSNSYVGYFVTPEEYEMQHYEGGHTVFGVWTSLLVRDTFVDLVTAIRDQAPAPEPSTPPSLGSTEAGDPTVGNGGVAGRLLAAPSGEIERMSVLELRWEGAPDGVDRPLGAPFITLERRIDGPKGDGSKGPELDDATWVPVDDDLGFRFAWQVADGEYTARYELEPDAPLGTHRFRITSGAYELITDSFEVVTSRSLRVRGATVERLDDGQIRVDLHAQNPPPDAELSTIARRVTPADGEITFVVNGRVHTAVWDASREAYSVIVAHAVENGDLLALPDGGFVDAFGNSTGDAFDLVVGEVTPLDWPNHMGPGGGRTPGVGGEGSFPP